VLLACYIAAGVVVCLPLATYPYGAAPLDGSTYVWDFWWVARQLTHVADPWHTTFLAAPAGMWLGYDTLMPLPAALTAPLTLAAGPLASFNLLLVLSPGLCCYAAYRAARLWLVCEVAAIWAGAFYGLATMLDFQDWNHLNIALGGVFLPLALEAAVRLRRRPGYRLAVATGVVLGAAMLVNQESATQAAILTVLLLLSWLVKEPSWVKARLALAVAAVGGVIASPQLAAMAAQSATEGAHFPPWVLARWDATFGVPLTTLVAPSPRLSTFHLGALAAPYNYGYPLEGVATFGLTLTVAALIGLVVGWRRHGARSLAALWAGTALLSLGTVLVVGGRRLMLLPMTWHGARMSALMPYTWLVQGPGLSSFREADRWALLGLLPAALLAGNAVDWLWQRRQVRRALVRVWVPLAVLLVGAVLEAGYTAVTFPGVPTAQLSSIASPIAADHSSSIVVDVPFGVRGIGPWGAAIGPEALVLATYDGHPRAVSYTSWAPASAVASLRRHPFYRDLVAAEKGEDWPRGQVARARRDAQQMRVRWAVVWRQAADAVPYLQAVGFHLDYHVGGVTVYRL
jgi:hypothetical protein